MLHIIEEVSLVLIAVRSIVLFPLTGAVLDSIREVSDVAGPIVPLVGTKAMRFAKLVLTSVNVSILERICSFAMLKTVNEFALVAIPVFPLMYTVAVIPTVFPLADVRLPIDSFPYAEALLDAIKPFTVIYFTIRPSECSLSMQLIVEVLA